VRIGGRRPPFAPDPDLIRMLADLLTETGLSELEYAVGDCRVRVARGGEVRSTSSVFAAPPPVTAGEPAAPQPAAEDALALHPGALTAPMVGVAYLAPQPGAAPFVRLGDTIIEGQVVLIIEAMKVMNQIRAPRPGRVSRILVEDAEPVEYGAVLMLIE
jgi:acetyl-CoA carboxylase biotin carboxyl carrier protein